MGQQLNNQVYLHEQRFNEQLRKIAESSNSDREVYKQQLVRKKNDKSLFEFIH